jgi:UPF0271 protein
MQTMTIDLNSDLGESFGRYRLGFDGRVMDFVTSANVACGFHAGDPSTMRATVRLAREKQVNIGAHPGFPDLQGFGRRDMALTPEEAYDMTLYQIGALDGFVRAEGLTLQHVKPHGALYNMAVHEPRLADALVNATRDYRRDLIFVGLPFSEMERAASRAAVRFAAEIFADRTYQSDGSLTPRSRPDAFVKDAAAAARRVVAMIQTQQVQTTSGETIPIRPDTVCLHGDNPEAVSFIEKITAALADAGIAVKPLSARLS